MTARWVVCCCVQIPHTEADCRRRGSHLDDVVRSHVPRAAVRRPRAAAGRRRRWRSSIQLCGPMAELAAFDSGPRLPDVHGSHRVRLSAGRHRLPVRAARLSPSRHAPSHPVTWCACVSGGARRDRASCRQYRHGHRRHLRRLLAAVLVLPSTPYVCLPILICTRAYILVTNTIRLRFVNCRPT